jgi:hypothetical protein
MIDEAISTFPSLLGSLIIDQSFTIEEVQDQLFPVHDIMHAWPKSLKDPSEYQAISAIFDPLAFWKFADPWDVTICTLHPLPAVPSDWRVV